MKNYKVEKTKIVSDNREMELYILKPVRNAKTPKDTPGILWIHGGGYVKGNAKRIYLSRALNLVKKYGAVVVTPEYRLATEAPYPAALLDCYDALRYIKKHAETLGINPSKIMVGGESAGGGLTAALCMYARDQGEVRIAYQMPLYPMLDDRDTDSSRDNHAPIWNTERNHKSWKMYLGELWEKEVPPYAAPARQTDYSHLPPAYTFVGDLEPFYCETLTYIENLKKAGIEARVDVYPNCVHSFDMFFPWKKASKIAIAEFEAQYLYAAEHYVAEQKKESFAENKQVENKTEIKKK